MHPVNFELSVMHPVNFELSALIIIRCYVGSNFF